MGAIFLIQPEQSIAILGSRSGSIFRRASKNGSRRESGQQRSRAGRRRHCRSQPLLHLSGGQRLNCRRHLSEPVIDAAARTGSYTSNIAGNSSPRYLRVYNIATKQDSVFVQPNGDTYSTASAPWPACAVVFLSTAQWGTSNPPGMTQLYTANLDGTGFIELTSGSEPTGIQQYTMSDDGQMAWYISGDGKLVKLDLSTGQPARTVFRPAAVDLSGTLVPGSVATLSGAGLSDAVYGASPASLLPTLLGKAKVFLNGIPAPLLSVAPGGITVQVPWEIQAGQPATLQVVTNAGTLVESSAQAAVTPEVRWPSLVPAQGCLSADTSTAGRSTRTGAAT